MKQFLSFSALFVAVSLSVPALAGGVSAYKNVRLVTPASSEKGGKASTVAGTLNLDPEHKNMLFVVKDNVRQTVPYRSISTLNYYMENHLLRVEFRGVAGEAQYLDMDLPSNRQHDVLRSIQDQTGIAVRLN